MEVLYNFRTDFPENYCFIWLLTEISWFFLVNGNRIFDLTFNSFSVKQFKLCFWPLCHFPRLLPVPNIELSGKCQRPLNGSYLGTEDFSWTKSNLRALKATDDIHETVLPEIKVNKVIQYFVLFDKYRFSSWELYKGTSVLMYRSLTSETKPRKRKLEGKKECER